MVVACDHVGASPPPSEEVIPSATIDVAPAAYFEAAWLSDDAIALARPEPGRKSAIVLIHDNGQQIAAVDRPKPADCDGQVFSALSRLDSGELAFAEVCEIDATGDKRSTFLAYDPVTTKVRVLGPVSEPPKVATWAPDGARAWFTAEGSLCATIYEFRSDQGQSPSDQPSSTNVQAQGHSFPLGEDLAAAPDRCTKFSRTDYPALGMNGDLSAFVSYVAGTDGQDRIDLPWALVSFPEQQTKTVLDGVVEPRGLGFAADGQYIFAGNIGGRPGLWRIQPNGVGLTRVGDKALPLMALSPDAKKVLAILVGNLTNPPETQTNAVIMYDLAAVIGSN